MHNQTRYCLILTAVVFAFNATAQAGSVDGWTGTREVRGSFGILIGTAGSDPRAAALVQTEMKGFIVQGTVVLKQVRASEDSILFQGTSKGLLFMQHKASVLEGQAAASEQVCSGTFDNGEFLLEIFPREREYQVQFSGEVPACAITTKYAASKWMASLFAKWYDEYRKLGEPWELFGADLKAARDQLALFSVPEKKNESITFSAAAAPEMRMEATSGFPVMHFYPLPEKKTEIIGSGKMQLTVSTSIFPTVVTTEAQWSLRATK
jgi:hypothetical protein